MSLYRCTFFEFLNRFLVLLCSELGINNQMKKDELLPENLAKVAVILIIVVSIIAIFKGGYQTGQWLYTMIHP
jgi:hypothetical protein